MVPITNCQWLYSQSKVFFLPFTVDQACKRTILRIMADASLVRSNLGMTMAQKIYPTGHYILRAVLGKQN